MNLRQENALWTWPLLVMGLTALATGVWVTAAGGRYIAPGVLAVLASAFVIFMAFAGRTNENGASK